MHSIVNGWSIQQKLTLDHRVPFIVKLHCTVLSGIHYLPQPNTESTLLGCAVFVGLNLVIVSNGKLFEMEIDWNVTVQLTAALQQQQQQRGDFIWTCFAIEPRLQCITNPQVDMLWTEAVKRSINDHDRQTTIRWNMYLCYIQLNMYLCNDPPLSDPPCLEQPDDITICTLNITGKVSYNYYKANVDIETCSGVDHFSISSTRW